MITENNEIQFTADTLQLEALAKKVLTEWFGEKCPDYDPDCECCKRWRSLDDLIENPFKEKETSP
jgi:hypothetical protein